MNRCRTRLTNHEVTRKWTDEQRMRVAGFIMAGMISNPHIDDQHLSLAAKKAWDATDALEAEWRTR